MGPVRENCVDVPESMRWHLSICAARREWHWSVHSSKAFGGCPVLAWPHRYLPPPGRSGLPCTGGCGDPEPTESRGLL